MLTPSGIIQAISGFFDWQNLFVEFLDQSLLSASFYDELTPGFFKFGIYCSSLFRVPYLSTFDNVERVLILLL